MLVSMVFYSLICIVISTSPMHNNQIPNNNNLCPSGTVKCLNETVFTFCFIHDQTIVFLEQTYDCPRGYQCIEEDAHAPCKKIEPVATIKSTTISSASSSRRTADIMIMTPSASDPTTITYPPTSQTTVPTDTAISTTKRSTTIVSNTIAANIAANIATETNPAAITTASNTITTVSNTATDRLAIASTTTVILPISITTIATNPEIITPLSTIFTTTSTTKRSMITTSASVPVTTLATTTTTALPPSTITNLVHYPICNASGNYPAPQCNQYYQCVHVLWWWHYKLMTCAQGKIFDRIVRDCIDIVDGRMNCSNIIM